MLLRARPPRRVGATLGVLVLATAAVLAASASVPVSALAPGSGGSAIIRSTAMFDASDEIEAAEADSVPKVTLAPTRAVLLSSDESMDFEAWIYNPGPDELAPGSIAFTLSPERVTDPAVVVAGPAVPDELGESPALPVLEAATPAVPAEEGRLVTLSVPRTDWPLTTATDAGVYLAFANVTFTKASDSLAAETPFVWRGAGGPANLQLAAIVPFTLPESIPSLPRRGQLDELFGPDSQLDSLLALAEGRGATLAIDPRVVAGVRAYGETASIDSRSFTERLVNTTAPSFTLQFADADPSAQAALGFTRLLAPEGLSFASRYGVFPPAAPGHGNSGNTPVPDDPAPLEPSVDSSVEANPTDKAPPASDPAGGGGNDSGSVNTVPEIGQLISWETSLTGTAWPAADSVNGEVLDLLALNGYHRVLATDANVSVAGGGALGRAGETEFLVSNETLNSAARAALSAESETEYHSGVAVTSALLALQAQTEVPGAVLAFDRAVTAESPYATALLETILGLPWIDPTAPEKLPEAAATLLPAAEAAAPERVEALADAVAREPEVRDYSRVLVEPENLVDLQRVRLLQLFSARYTPPDGGFEAAAAFSVERDAGTLNGIQLVTSTHTQLIGATSRVPVQVRNTLPFDALLTAEVVSTSAALIVTEPSVEATLVPRESSANMLVPVRARVSSGESGLSVAISAASGGDVIAEGELDISIRSSWETLALGVLGVFTAGFFGFGIWRSIRQRKLSRPKDAEGIVAP